ncbi:MAG: DUF5518 domain-containing protein [Halapricum sp.]
MESKDTEPAVQQAGRTPEPLSRLVEWVVSALLVLGGLMFAALGIGVYGGANRSWIASLVDDGTIESTELTRAQLIDVVHGFAWWGGIGLLVTGALLIVGGVAFLAYRRRSRARREERGITTPDTTTNAIVGGVVTVVVSAIPFSPVLGGAVSGYLQGTTRTDGARVGAYAGLVAAAPIVVLFAFFLIGFAILASELGFVAPMLLGIVGLFVGLLLAVAYLVGLSALGGYLGVALGERDDVPA